MYITRSQCFDIRYPPTGVLGTQLNQAYGIGSVPDTASESSRRRVRRLPENRGASPNKGRYASVSAAGRYASSRPAGAVLSGLVSFHAAIDVATQNRRRHNYDGDSVQGGLAIIGTILTPVRHPSNGHPIRPDVPMWCVVRIATVDHHVIETVPKFTYFVNCSANR